jgi:tRNA pseudouridine38-40 synthase
MHAAAQAFVGRHNFSLFSRAGERNPERRVLAARVLEEGPFTVFEVTGESFLWNMVRCMATALERVGRGEMEPEEIARFLAGAAEQRLPAAPPDGLILWDVDCGIPFTPLPVGEKTCRYLDDRRRYHALMAEVSVRLTPE